MKTIACLLASAYAAIAYAATLDPLGIAELYPSRAQGAAYYATSWSNGKPRSFKDSVDPQDPWFDAGHGQGSYSIDGKGKLIADGDIVRMYVHNPDKQTEWTEDLEITVYITRLSEKQRVSYSGAQIFARTNHGTYTGSFGGESKTLCDDRGLGAKINLDGTWAFEKETCHGADKGYATGAPVHFWTPQDGFPLNKPIGVKYIIHNRKGPDGHPQVSLELYSDVTGGKDGGTWVKVTDMLDRGKWGMGSTPCAAGVDPALVHTRANLLDRSETGRPELSVYFRHEYARMAYQRLSVREIQPAL